MSSPIPDDVPELVESSDDDTVSPPVGNGDYAELWLKRCSGELEDADKFIRQMVYGPMLFGIENSVEKLWIEALYSARIILTKNRAKNANVFNENEEEMILLMENLIRSLQPEMRSKKHLRCALKIVDVVEKTTRLKKTTIDIDAAIDISSQFKIFRHLVANISVPASLKKEGEFGMIFIFKNYHRHVVAYAKYNKIIMEDIKKEWRIKLDGGFDANNYKEMGNEAYKNNNFKQAIEYYGNAISRDPINHKFYGNRALVYLKLGKFREAFCDGRRSVVIDPKWEKGYYRCSEAALEMKLFQVAITYNKQGQTMCDKMSDSLYEQEKKISEAMKTTTCNSDSTRLNSLLEEIKNKQKGSYGNTSGPFTAVDINVTYNNSNVQTANQAEEDDMPTLVSDHDSDDSKSRSVAKKQKRKKKARSEARTTVDVMPEYTVLLIHGSEAYLAEKFKQAVIFYQQSFDFLQNHPTLEKSIDDIDIVILKYSFGMASLGIGVYKSVMEGLNRFLSICKIHCHVCFPPVYYGIAKSFVELHRYSEAVEPCQAGLMAVKNGVNCGRFLWPGLDHVIPHTQNDLLAKCLKELLTISQFPPLPDAICRFHIFTQEEQQTFMYYTDLNFKGFVRIECLSLCNIQFHNNCWKFYKQKAEKSSDKEMLNTACPTPDCFSIIYKIILVRQDRSNKCVKLDSIPDAYIKKSSCKPIIRMKPSLSTVAKRQEKKRVRKQRKKEEKLQEIRGDNMEAEVRPKEYRVGKESCIHHLHQTDMTVLRKDELSEERQKKYKSSKSKKRKDKKATNIFNVEVSFSDRKIERLYGGSTDFEGLQNASTMSDFPFSVPTNVHDQMEQMMNPEALEVLGCDDNVCQNLFNFFADLLEKHGPIHVHDKVLLSSISELTPDAKEVIQHAGGIRCFLQKSLKFAMIDDFFCLLKDAVRARDLALKKKSDKNRNTTGTVGGFNVANMDAKTSDTDQQVMKPRVSHSNASLADISLPSSVSASSLTPLPLPTKLRLAVFDAEEPETSSASDKKDAEVNVWMERMDKRKATRVKEVKPANEKFVSELIKLQNVNSNSKSQRVKKLAYNNLDNFVVPANSSSSKSMNALDDFDDLDKFMPTKSKHSMDDINDFTQTEYDKPNQYSKSHESMETTEPSRCSSVSDISEQSDISIDILYRTGSPSSVSSKSSVPQHVRHIGRDSPLSQHSSPNSPIAPFSQHSITMAPTAKLFPNVIVSEVSSSSAYKISTKKQSDDIPTFVDSINNFHNSMFSTPPPGIDGKLSYSNSTIPNLSSFPPPPLFSYNQLAPKPARFGPPPSQYAGENTTGVQAAFWTPNVNANTVFQSPIHPNMASNWTKPVSAPLHFYPPPVNTASKMADIEHWNQRNQVYQPNIPLPLLTNVTSRSCDVEIQTENVVKDVGVNTEMDIHKLLVNHDQLITDNQSLCNQVNQIQSLNRKSEGEREEMKLKVETLTKIVEERNGLVKGLMDALKKRDTEVSDMKQQHDNIAKEYGESRTELEQLRMLYIQLSDSLQVMTGESNQHLQRAKTAEIQVLKSHLVLSEKSFNPVRIEANFHIEHLNILEKKCFDEKTNMPPTAFQALIHWRETVKTLDNKFSQIKTAFEGQMKLIDEGRKLTELPPISTSPPPLPTTQNMNPTTIPNQDCVFNLGKPPYSFTTPPPFLTSAQHDETFTGNLGSKIGNAPGDLQTWPRPKPMGQPLMLIQDMPTAITPTWPVGNGASVQGIKTNTSMNKLVNYIQQQFPRYHRNDLMRVLSELRMACGGSLSGRTMNSIVHMASEKLKNHNAQNEDKSVSPPPGFPSRLSSPNLELFTEDEDPCAICTDELSLHKIQVLDCKHRFHEKCLKLWFKEQKTCPNCRVHTLLPEEFPSLK